MLFVHTHNNCKRSPFLGSSLCTALPTYISPFTNATHHTYTLCLLPFAGPVPPPSPRLSGGHDTPLGAWKGALAVAAGAGGDAGGCVGLESDDKW